MSNWGFDKKIMLFMYRTQLMTWRDADWCRAPELMRTSLMTRRNFYRCTAPELMWWGSTADWCDWGWISLPEAPLVFTPVGPCGRGGESQLFGGGCHHLVLPTFSGLCDQRRKNEREIKAGNQGVDFNGRLRKEKCGFNRWIQETNNFTREGSP